MTTELWAVGLVLLSSVVGSFGPIYLKRAADVFSPHPLKVLTNWNLWKGFSFYAFGTAVFIPALRGGDLSVLYPLISISYVFVSLYSIKFLGEKMNRFKWAGIACIIIGVSLIGVGSS